MSSPAFDAGPLAPVQCVDVDDQVALVFEKDFAQSATAVWSQLTAPDRLEQWAPFRPDRPLDQPGAIILYMDGPKRQTKGVEQGGTPAKLELAGRLEQVVVPHLLVYTWGEDELHWALQSRQDGGTRLLLTQRTAGGRDWVPKLAAGWHLCLYVMQRQLEGRPIPRIIGMDAKNFGWDQLNAAYAAALGITVTGLPEEQ